MRTPETLANQIADRSAATLVAGLIVATLLGNAMLWAGWVAGL